MFGLGRRKPRTYDDPVKTGEVVRIHGKPYQCMCIRVGDEWLATFNAIGRDVDGVMRFSGWGECKLPADLIAPIPKDEQEDLLRAEADRIAKRLAEGEAVKNQYTRGSKRTYLGLTVVVDRCYYHTHSSGFEPMRYAVGVAWMSKAGTRQEHTITATQDELATLLTPAHRYSRPTAVVTDQ